MGMTVAEKAGGIFPLLEREGLIAPKA